MMRILIFGAFLTSIPILKAAIVFTVEAPGVQQSTASGVVTETFDSLPPGALAPFTSAVGVYSSGGLVVAADEFGGANSTNYASVGNDSGVLQYSLALNGLQSYFGLYWSAIDEQNRLEFFQGDTLQGSFSSSDILPALSPAYFGNPNNSGQTAEEGFAFLNFVANDPASRFDRVVFRNLPATSDFESDNHTTAAASEIPEPSSWTLMAIGLVTVLASARRHRILTDSRQQ
jgi:hypothetical protein